MNDDMNLAAWMIAGGASRSDTADTRSRAHLRALETRQSGPTLIDRVAAALGLRSTGPGATAPAQLDTICCAA